MARLIDADIFAKNLEDKWILHEISNNDLTQIIEWLAQEQTVDAIPIEWVNKWIKEHESWGWGEATFTSSVEIMVSDFLRERSNNYLLPGFTVIPNAERKEE